MAIKIIKEGKSCLDITTFIKKVRSDFHANIPEDYPIEKSKSLKFSIQFLQILVWIGESQEVFEITIRKNGDEVSRITEDLTITAHCGKVKLKYNSMYNSMYDAFVKEVEIAQKPTYEIMNGDQKLIVTSENTFFIVLKTLYYTRGEDFTKWVRIRRPFDDVFSVPDVGVICKISQIRELLLEDEY